MMLDEPDQPQLFDGGLGVLCPSCPALRLCKVARTANACSPKWGSTELGGEHVLHPAKSDISAFMDAVDGLEFGTIEASPVRLPRVPPYLPQVRTRRGLRGFLDEDVYGVRARVVIEREVVLPAAALKRLIGLPPNAKVVLLLFDADDVIERLYREARTLLPQLVNAGYDLVVAPSYSCWWPRPRIDHLYNLKRSLWVYGALQRYGIPAVPRVAWAANEDAERFAAWIRCNPSVEMVGVDLMTYRADRWWQAQMRGLHLFDDRTSGRLRYLVNGPSELERFVDVYEAVDPSRVTITNLAIARPPRAMATKAVPQSAMGPRLQGEIARDRWLLALARRRACSAPNPPNWDDRSTDVA